MYPYLFPYSHHISLYSVFFVIALLIVILGSKQCVAKHCDRSTKQINILLLVTCLAGIFWARLLHVITRRSTYAQNPSLIFDVSAQGFSGYGGIVLAWIAWWLVCLHYKHSMFKVADLIAPFLGLGIGAMRLWCFLQWCCFGTSTDVMRWVRFPEWSEVSRYQLYKNISQHGFFGTYHVDLVHPAQIYDMLVALSGAVISYRLWKKWTKEGIPFLFFIIRYTVGKYLLTPFRAPPLSNNVSPELYLIMYVITISVICIAFFAFHFKKNKKWLSSN